MIEGITAGSQYQPSDIADSIEPSIDDMSKFTDLDASAVETVNIQGKPVEKDVAPVLNAVDDNRSLNYGTNQKLVALEDRYGIKLISLDRSEPVPDGAMILSQDTDTPGQFVAEGGVGLSRLTITTSVEQNQDGLDALSFTGRHAVYDYIAIDTRTTIVEGSGITSSLARPQEHAASLPSTPPR